MKRSTRKLLQKLLNECLKTQSMKNRASFHHLPCNNLIIVFGFSQREELCIDFGVSKKYLNRHIKNTIAYVKKLNKPD